VSLTMLDRQIEICPDEIWGLAAGGFQFWQQVFHALTGAMFWTRPHGREFVEPHDDRKLFPELDGEPEGALSRSELSELSTEVRAQIATLLADRTDAWLKQPSWIYDKVLNFDVLVGQIRHLQYHVGHCNSILRENDAPAAEWLDHPGEERGTP
jgi:hypothetical protein